MTYLELTPYLKGDKFYVPEKPIKSKQRIATDEEISLFCNILSINRRYANMIKVTNSATSFFKAAGDIASLFSKDIHDDLFYSMKIGNRYNGVPSKLVYLLLKARAFYIYPNLSLSMIKRTDLLYFCIEGMLANDTTVLDVVRNIWKADVLLLSYRRFKALYTDVYEVWVNQFVRTGSDKTEQFDQVAVINEKIIDKMDDIDWKNIVLYEDMGLIANNTVLRYLDGMYGIVEDDMNLTVVH